MDSPELTEWEAYFKLEAQEAAGSSRAPRSSVATPVKADVKASMRDWFGDRVKKKNK